MRSIVREGLPAQARSAGLGGSLLVLGLLLSACGGSGSSAPRSQPPVIYALTTSSTEVDFGESVTLAWQLDGGAPATLTLDGADVLGTASASRIPSRRHVFTLTAANDGGQVSKTIIVSARGLDIVAGSPDGQGYRDGAAGQARLGGAIGIALAEDGSVYFSDDFAIRKMASDGVVTTIAGSPGQQGSVDGVGGQARFTGLYGVGMFDLTLDNSGNLYAADNLVGLRKVVLATGAVTTLQGVATRPRGLAFDAAHNRLYISGSRSDLSKPEIQWLNLETLAVSDVPGTSYMELSGSAHLMTLDDQGNLYFQDSQQLCVTKVSLADGEITRLAGYAGYLGSGDGAWNGLDYDGAGHLLMATSGGTAITRIDIGTGAISVIAGSLSSYGQHDGIGSGAFLSMLTGLKCKGGKACFWDAGTLRKLDLATDEVTTLVGQFSNAGYREGRTERARFNTPTQTAVDGRGNIYVYDWRNRVIRIVTTGGDVDTFLDLKNSEYEPQGLAADGGGNLYLTLGGAVMKVSPAGEMRVLAGDPQGYDYLEGTGSAARFRTPMGLAVDQQGVVYVADADNLRIRRIAPDGTTSLLAGSGGQGQLDGTGAAAQFYYCGALALDRESVLVVGDSSLRRIELATCAVTTVSEGLLCSSLAVDGSGVIYGILRQSIWRLEAGGTTPTTLCGGVLPPWCNEPGPLPTSLFDPYGLAATPDGDLVFCANNGILQITRP